MMAADAVVNEASHLLDPRPETEAADTACEGEWDYASTGASGDRPRRTVLGSEVRIHHTEPLGAFTDALFAVIATILAATSVVSEEQAQALDQKTAGAFTREIVNLVFEAGLMFLVINIIFVYWLRVVRLFSLIESASAVTITLHMTTVALLGILPFLASVAASTFIKLDAKPAFKAIAGQTLVATLVAIALASLGSTLSALRFDAMLAGGYPVLALRLQEARVALELGVHFLVLCIGLVSEHVWNWVYVVYVVMPLGIVAIETLTQRRNPGRYALYLEFVNAIDVTRLQQLVDGIFGVTASVIVLDVRIPDDLFDRGYRLDRFLLEAAPRILGYGLSFVLSAILWYQWRIILSHCERTQGLAFHVLTLEALAMASFIPFAMSLVVGFDDSIAAGGIALLVALLSSLLQIASLFTAALKQGPGEPTRRQLAGELALMLPLASIVGALFLPLSPTVAVCALALPLPIRRAFLYIRDLGLFVTSRVQRRIRA